MNTIESLKIAINSEIGVNALGPVQYLINLTRAIADHMITAAEDKITIEGKPPEFKLGSGTAVSIMEAQRDFKYARHLRASKVQGRVDRWMHNFSTKETYEDPGAAILEAGWIITRLMEERKEYVSNYMTGEV